MPSAPTSFEALRATLQGAPAPDTGAIAAAEARNETLTKPPGALGRLEEIAIWLGGWQGKAIPTLDNVQVLIFAGNHGVTAQGVSAFPAEVTAQMVMNFEHGGAAINQLSNAFGAKFEVHALDLETPTGDFTQTEAMSEADCLGAIAAGWNALDTSVDLMLTGEMGIGNTTSAAAIACALYGGDPDAWVGRGTGVDDAGLQRKADVVARGLARHPAASQDPISALRCLGGREIAAMFGAMAHARVAGVPMLIDGFIASSAAAVLHALGDGMLDHAIAAHKSDEAAHKVMLDRMGKTPLLDLGLRLGEGSGAALALGILRGAVACHGGMASFADAGVSEG
ncbi:MAG: nicotinate-nucleotide--dimethylbenzimidazole phosphoribosyltransferase [Dinoroseobacter sp.]|nr:nicotinate-nucleotide--dimethylbenzimidazole phosphoribosyltransferase [Dinoroseobacter sp.]